MAIKLERRSHDIGAGIYGMDVAHWGIARRGGVVAHPPCVALRNNTANDMYIAVQRGKSLLKGTLADDLDEFINLSPEFKLLGAGELLPLGMCYKEFNLGNTSSTTNPVTVTCADGGAPSYVITATLTTNMPSAAGTYYFYVEVLADNYCTMTWTDVNSTFTIVQNQSIAASDGIGIGKTTFIMKAVVTGASTGSTLVFTPVEPANQSGIATGDVRVWLITEWTVGNVSAEY